MGKKKEFYYKIYLKADEQLTKDKAKVMFEALNDVLTRDGLKEANLGVAGIHAVAR